MQPDILMDGEKIRKHLYFENQKRRKEKMC